MNIPLQICTIWIESSTIQSHNTIYSFRYDLFDNLGYNPSTFESDQSNSNKCLEERSVSWENRLRALEQERFNVLAHNLRKSRAALWRVQLKSYFDLGLSPRIIPESASPVCYINELNFKNVTLLSCGPTQENLISAFIVIKYERNDAPIHC